MHKLRVRRGQHSWARRLVITAILLLSSHRALHADFIATVTVNVKPLGSGLDEYDYTVSNSSQSTVDAYAFGLTIDQGADLQSITSPTGWQPDYTLGSTTISWSTGTDALTPGNSALFSFDSLESPTSMPYQVTGFDPTMFQFYPSTGSILAPGVASVPEPGSLVLSGIGALGVLAILARRGRQAASSATRLQQA